MRYRIGTQGWSYARWAGPFYPTESGGADLLSLYARAFDTVEVNSTFYAIPPADRFRDWRERTPTGFEFAVKLPGEITHETRLSASRASVEHFCRRARRLGDKLGPILVQLPPDFGVGERQRLEAFLAELPDDLRFAVEFRDPEWLGQPTLRMLERAGVTLALSVGPWLSTDRAVELLPRIPGPALYLRWMGHDRTRPPPPRGLEGPGGGAPEPGRAGELADWAAALRSESDRREVAYGFFNDDFAGHAPASARRLQRLLGEDVVEPSALSEQRDLFR